MRVIILCAGVSERLRPETYKTNKNLLEINGKTLIEHLLDTIIYSEVDVDTVHIIIGHYGYKFRELLGSNYMGLKIRFHTNSLYNITGAAQSLYLALNVLKEYPCTVLEGDHYLDPELMKKLLNSKYDNCLLVDDDKSKLTFGEETIAYGSEGTLDILHWPARNFHNYPDSLLIGEALTIFKLSKQASNSLATVLETYLSSPGSAKREIIEPLNMLRNLHDIQYLITEGRQWIEIDFPADLEKAREMKFD